MRSLMFRLLESTYFDSPGRTASCLVLCRPRFGKILKVEKARDLKQALKFGLFMCYCMDLILRVLKKSMLTV